MFKKLKGIIIVQLENERKYINLSCLKEIEGNCLSFIIHLYFPLNIVITHYYLNMIISFHFPLHMNEQMRRINHCSKGKCKE